MSDPTTPAGDETTSTTPTRGRRSVWRGRGLALADQGFSSLSNVLAVFLVAQALDKDGFGRFSLAYAILVAVLGVSRSWFGTRLSLIGDRSAVHGAARTICGSLTWLALPLVVFVLALGTLVTGGGSAELVVVVALATPVVCLQDALRFAAVAAGRPGAALASDALWALVLVALWPAAGRLSGSFVLWMWLAAAGLALAVLVVALRVLPDLRAGWHGLRERHRTSESVSIGTVVTLGASLLVTSVVGRVLSPADAGSLRGASTLLGPINVVLAFINLALTPALVRRVRTRDLRFCTLVGLATLGVTLCWGAVLLLMPRAWGEAALDETWAGTREVLPYTLLEYAGLAVAVAWTLGLKVRGEARMLVRQKVAVAALMVVCGCVGAIVLDDVRAVSAGLALAAVAGVAIGFHNLWTSVRRGRKPSGEVPVAPAVG